jgi:hypothetical protein
MQAVGMNYRAVRDIAYNGVRAFNAGDLVHEALVDGPHAWVTLDDVEPVEGVRLEVPALNASQSQWAAYAVSTGADADAAAGMTRAQLIAKYGPAESSAKGHGDGDQGQAEQ